MVQLKDGEIDWVNLVMRQIGRGFNDIAISILENKIEHPLKIDADGSTLLHFAAQQGNAEITDYLIDTGYEINAKDNNNRTPLMHLLLNMAYTDHASAMDIILSLTHAGANVLAPDKEGLTALRIVFTNYMAEEIVKHFLDVIDFICEGDAEDIAEILLGNNCTLERAILLNNPELTDVIIRAGRLVDEHNPFHGNTALHTAVRTMSVANVKVLIASGASVYAADHRGLTPLQYYCLTRHDCDYRSRQRPEIVEILLSKLKHPNELFRNRFIISSVLKYGNDDVIRILLRQDLDLRLQNSHGWTMVHLLAKNPNPNIFSLLVGQNYDPNITVSWGYSPLSFAIICKNTNTIEWLLKNGADPNLINRRAPLIGAMNKWIQERRGGLQKRYDIVHRKNISLLLQYGADLQLENRSFILKILRSSREFDMAEMLLAHLALNNVNGQRFTKFTRNQIMIHKNYYNHVLMCKRKLERMKNITIYRSLSLFSLFNVNEEQTARRFAFNDIFLSRLKSIRRKYFWNYYFFGIVRKHLDQIAMYLHALHATGQVIRNTMKFNELILREITSYLTFKDMAVASEALRESRKR